MVGERTLKFKYLIFSLPRKLRCADNLKHNSIREPSNQRAE
jgi:hypothetical protein